MNRFAKLALTSVLASALALIAVVPAASAQPRVFIGFGGYYGPGYYYGPAYYRPGWYGPAWYGWYGSPGYAYHSEPSNTGQVKIETKAKDAMVYVDGSYAGKVKDLKTFHLQTGEHTIELRDPSGHSYYQERVNVLPDKTLKLTPESR